MLPTDRGFSSREEEEMAAKNHFRTIVEIVESLHREQSDLQKQKSSPSIQAQISALVLNMLKDPVQSKVIGERFADLQLREPIRRQNTIVPEPQRPIWVQRLDRSISEPHTSLVVGKKSVNQARYKTELCRQYEEKGRCQYGEKCQFAHGAHEKRSVERHPKYKTEMCRTFHEQGLCSYGQRCNFIHNEDERHETRVVDVPQQTRLASQQHNFMSPLAVLPGDLLLGNGPGSDSSQNSSIQELTRSLSVVGCQSFERSSAESSNFNALLSPLEDPFHLQEPFRSSSSAEIFRQSSFQPAAVVLPMDHRSRGRPILSRGFSEVAHPQVNGIISQNAEDLGNERNNAESLDYRLFSL